MQIAIVALGSRGDVQPYVALGKGLQRAGHAVRLVTHDTFENLVKTHVPDYRVMRGSVEDVAQSEEMRALLAKGNFIAITAYTAKAAERAALLWAEDGLAACEGADLIVAGIGGLFIGIALAQRLRIPFLQAYLLPFTPTGVFPSVLLPPGAAFKRLTHDLTRQMMWQGFRTADTLARRRVLGLPAAPFWGPFPALSRRGLPVLSRRGLPVLSRRGLPVLSRRGLPVLYGFSPSVLPMPADWGSDVHVTGYWFLGAQDGWTPPAALTAFLDAGPAPVYVGFGSMGSREPEAMTALVLDALAQAGQRAVLLSGWGGLGREHLPEHVFMADALPHDWLFPRMAALVHHGGAGTTAAALRAGVPSVVILFFADQPFWGARVQGLGVGTAPIARQKLSAGRLADALRQTADAGMRQRAAALGARIRGEDGVARAVALIGAL